MSSHKARRRRQRLKRKYARLREDAQLAGIIPTTPEGAVRDERVDPSTQTEDCRGLPALVRRALREGWSVPDAAKPAIVDALIRPFYERYKVVGPDGELVEVKAPPMLLIALARTLILLDREQWKRDQLAQADGSSKPVILQVNVQTVAPLPDSIESTGPELANLDDRAGRVH